MTTLEIPQAPAMPADMSQLVKRNGVDQEIIAELIRRQRLYEDVGIALDGTPDILRGPDEPPIEEIDDPYSSGTIRMQLLEKPIVDPTKGFVIGQSRFVAKVFTANNTRSGRNRFGELTTRSHPYQRIMPMMESVTLYRRGRRAECSIPLGPCSLPPAEHIFIEQMVCEYLGAIGLWPLQLNQHHWPGTILSA